MKKHVAANLRIKVSPQDLYGWENLKSQRFQGSEAGLGSQQIRAHLFAQLHCTGTTQAKTDKTFLREKYNYHQWIGHCRHGTVSACVHSMWKMLNFLPEVLFVPLVNDKVKLYLRLGVLAVVAGSPCDTVLVPRQTVPLFAVVPVSVSTVALHSVAVSVRMVRLHQCSLLHSALMSRVHYVLYC